MAGDQAVTACNAASCKATEAAISGRGLLPWIITCSDQNKDYWADNIHAQLVNLITGQTPMILPVNLIPFLRKTAVGF